MRCLAAALVLSVLVSGASAQTHKPASAAPDLGWLQGGIYTNKFFRLSYELSPGWSDQTAQMRKQVRGEGKSFLLLSVFEKPAPEPGSANASVTILAESQSLYPEVDSGDDYLAVLGDLAAKKGLSAAGDPVAAGPPGREFYRQDFEGAGTPPVYQSSFAAVARGYIVSVTLIAGTRQQLDELVARLRLAPPPAPARKHK